MPVESKKVFITGANGFLGSNLCFYLAGQGYDVTAAIRSGAQNSNLKHQNIRIVTTGYQDDLNDIIEDSDYIVHAAALLSSNFKSKRKDFYKTNVILTEELLEKASKSRKLKRFIFISSVGIYGPTGEKCASEDRAAGKDLTGYEWSKHEAEKKCQEFFKKGVPIIILRLSQLYGPGMKYGWPKIFKEISDKKFFLIGRAEGSIQPLYIDDAVKGIEAAMVSNANSGEVFNMAGREIIILHNLFNQIAELLNAGKLKNIPYWPVYLLAYFLKFIPASLKSEKLNLLTIHNISFFREFRCYDIMKAAKQLNFNPLVDIKEGLKNTLRWYQESYNKHE
jgi:nucleoside-diphosphate-sugar epimerase